ncbi:MAG: hypothetical protein JSV53_06695 [candidate division WOR-3 bacterium]|nr:MAG: hypothetical protein JSV53_06695 [candidate division WOR-3 bacterium]
MHIILLLLPVFVGINTSGYVETRPYLTWNDSTNVLGYNRGWLEFKTEDSNYGAQIVLDLVIPYDTTSVTFAVDNTNISRLALWLGNERTRIIVGKQSLYWGVARVFRPLDIFNNVNYFEPGYERPGTNALLGYYSFGRLSSLRGIVMPRGDIERTLTGARIGTNLLANDLGITVMHESFEHRTIVGGEITGELLLGYWAEASYTWHDTINYSKISIGIDYTFPLAIYSMVEYFFDGSGEDDPTLYDYTRIASGERQTLGQQYLYVSIGLLRNPFLRPSISSIINISDEGMILIPQVDYAIFDNVEIALGMNYAFGPDESEFRNITPYRGAVYVWAKVYF